VEVRYFPGSRIAIISRCFFRGLSFSGAANSAAHIDHPQVTFELFVFDLLVDSGDETLDCVVLLIGNEVGEVDRLLAMRLRSRH